MKLTPRQIQVLAEIFDGTEPDWRSMTRAQVVGRERVIRDMRGYNIERSALEPRARAITLCGLLALEPHYADKPKIAAAIEARREYEREQKQAAEREKAEREEASRQRIARRNAKLIEGYRRILADCHIPIDGVQDSLVLEVGNRIAEFEGMV